MVAFCNADNDKVKKALGEKHKLKISETQGTKSVDSAYVTTIGTRVTEFFALSPWNAVSLRCGNMSKELFRLQKYCRENKEGSRKFG